MLFNFNFSFTCNVMVFYSLSPQNENVFYFLNHQREKMRSNQCANNDHVLELSKFSSIVHGCAPAESVDKQANFNDLSY